MSFSTEVKKEIVRHVPAQRDAQMAGLAAAAACMGVFSKEKSGRLHMEIPRDGSPGRALLFTLLEKTAKIVVVSDYWQNDSGKTIDLSDILTQDVILQFSRNAQMQFGPDGTGTSAGVHPHLLRSDSCIRSYIADTFVCTGSVSDPEKEYYLSFSCSGQYACQLQQYLRRYGIVMKQQRRAERSVVYTKDAGTIENILNLCGAGICAMQLVNARIVKSMRGRVNRQVNCETANIRKTVNAARRQIEDIRYLMDRKEVFAALPAALRQTAELRLRYPDLSLQELGEKFTPKVGKSGVNHRLRKLTELAQGARLNGKGTSGGDYD